ncbi:hypothetical protein Rhe02_75510 [Rhizocola hellebori]|uniref:Uncharacterized protein n=1 Tax=Rhizocola hellebori TaxID=1392758 RepID=A0A8J3QH14_9ACTN|nr:hypothetical protein [Rhizocola hellebori]GIH09484.1 hypothetical protein Rhe02_75510 [Rhizocola hellebori]
MSTTFDAVLRVAIANRGLSLSRLHARLRDRGLDVSLASLSNWQRGKCRPEPAKSLAAITVLEEVLQVPAGHLVALLGPRRPRGRWVRRPPGVMSPDEMSAMQLSIEKLLADIDGASEPALRWRSVREHVSVRGDRGEGTVRTEIVFEALHDGADRHIAFHHNEQGVLPELTGSSGCRIGRIKVDPSAAVCAVELLFDHALQRGETYVVDYDFAHPSPPPSTTYQRWFRYPVRDFLLQVEFAAGAVPASCHQVWQAGSGTWRRDVRRLWPNRGKTVHVAEQNVTPGVHGIRWEW